MTEPTHDQAVATLAKLIKGAGIAMLTTMTADGTHVSRPMALQTLEFDGDLWFFVHDDSDKAGQVRRNPQVNLAFSDDGQSTWTSISGRAAVVHDRARAEELWSAPLKTWFPDGLETDGLALLRVTAESAEYWDASSSKLKQVVGGLRAAVTGDPDNFPATNETMKLT